jgi:hypothetical protein
MLAINDQLLIGCQWKGPLSDVEMHFSSCRFSGDKLPEWYNTYLKSKETELEKQDQEEELLVN